MSFPATQRGKLESEAQTAYPQKVGSWTIFVAPSGRVTRMKGNAEDCRAFIQEVMDGKHKSVQIKRTFDNDLVMVYTGTVKTVTPADISVWPTKRRERQAQPKQEKLPFKRQPRQEDNGDILFA